MSFSTLLRISRPRFRHYVLWPVLLLYAYIWSLPAIQMSLAWWYPGNGMIIVLMMIGLLGYFSFPANLWIYGWNDIADTDTDIYNSKKWNYENKIDSTWNSTAQLKRAIWLRNIAYILCFSVIFSVLIPYQDYLLFDTPSTVSWLLWLRVCVTCIALFLPFLITSYLYSCPPLRAKAKPWIDGLMNILYIITPLIIGALVSRESRNAIVHSAPDTVFRWGYIITIAFPALCRCMAMHCYSAIPDIDADRQAWLTTTAVYLGKQKALIYCGILYLVSAIFSFSTLWWMSIVGGIVYLTMIGISYCYEDIFWLYKKFPLINLIIGFCLFRYILLFYS